MKNRITGTKAKRLFSLLLAMIMVVSIWHPNFADSRALDLSEEITDRAETVNSEAGEGAVPDNTIEEAGNLISDITENDELKEVDPKETEPNKKEESDSKSEENSVEAEEAAEAEDTLAEVEEAEKQESENVKLDWLANQHYEVAVEVKKPTDGWYSSYGNWVGEIGSASNFAMIAKIATDDKAAPRVQLAINEGYKQDFSKGWFTDLKIYDAPDSEQPIQDLEFKALDEVVGYQTIKGRCWFSLPYVNQDGIYKGMATLDDQTTSSIHLILKWETLKQVLPKVEKPMFSPEPGEITKPTTVSISTATEGATIYYTTDGSYPSKQNGKQYQNPFVIKNTTKVRALAIKTEMDDSSVETAEYTWAGNEEPVFDDFSGLEFQSQSEFEQLILTTDDESYFGVMKNKVSRPTVSQYYVLIEQGEVSERHLYNGGIGGFSVSQQPSQLEVRVLLAKDKWDLDKPVQVKIVCQGFQTKELELDLKQNQIRSQKDVQSQNGTGKPINIADMQPGKSYTGKFSAYRIDDQATESMLSGFFEKSVCLTVDSDGQVKASFRNMVMAHAMLDFAIQRTDKTTWQSAIADGSRIPEKDTAGQTIAAAYEIPIDVPTQPLVGGVNVTAMGGSEANTGDFKSYTQVFLKFEPTVVEGFAGFEGANTGLTKAKTRNRFLITVIGMDANDDGYVSDQEIAGFTNFSERDGKKTLDLKRSSILSDHYSVFDCDALTDIRWLRYLDKRVESINLRGHNISEINDELKGFTNLKNLDLAANKIMTIQDGAFSDLGQVSDIALSTNLLRYISKGTFKGLTSVSGSLDLMDNRISRLEAGAFADTQITGIYLNNNYLRKIEVAAFEGLNNFERLVVSNNQLAEIPADLSSLSSLKTINLNRNRIDQIGQRLDHLAAGASVDLSNNMIKEVPSSVIGTNTLASLKLENNCVCQLPANLAGKVLDSEWNFGSVLDKNAIDLEQSDLSSLSADQIQKLKQLLQEKGNQKNILELKLTAENGKIRFEQDLAAFDYYFWGLTRGGWGKEYIEEAVKAVLGKETIENKQEYKQFRQANLLGFSQEEMKKSILCDTTGTIKDFDIQTVLEKKVDGEWIPITQISDVLKADAKQGEFTDSAMKRGDQYRLSKQLNQRRSFDFFVTAYAMVGQGGNPENPQNPDNNKVDITKNGKYKVGLRLWHENKNQASMGDAAFKNNRWAYVTTDDGLYHVEVATNPITIGDITAGIGVILSEDGKMENIQTQNSQLPNGKDYVSKISFRSRSLPAHYMITITAPGSPMQGYFNARLILDWDTVEKANDNLVPNTDAGSGSAPTDQAKKEQAEQVEQVKAGQKISPDKVEQLVKDQKQLKIEAKAGQVQLDLKALLAVKNQIRTDFELKLEPVVADELSPAQRKAIAQRPVYRLELLSGNKKITDFKDGRVSIELNYELKDNEKAENLIVWYIDANEKITEIPCKYDQKRKKVQFSTNHFSLYAIGYHQNQDWDNPFQDIKAEAWYFDGVRFVAQKELMQGVSRTRFEPEQAMSRAMLVTVLYRLEQQPTVDTKAEFSDVAAGAWYEAAVNWAVANEIVQGYGQGQFGSEDQLTREQLAVILYRYANHKKTNPKTSLDLKQFGDHQAISEFAQPAISWAVEAEIMKGVGAAKIEPKAVTNRAQLATMLMRYIQNQVK